jgi:NTP pyrophosphatase (non-canonical NTP hydrolase)
VGDLQEALRKDAGEVAVRSALARTVSRVFCIAEHFFDLPLPQVFAEKYLQDCCAYCLTSPCHCPERRPEPQLREPTQERTFYTLRDIAVHLDFLYGSRNKERGMEYLLNRLFKEVSELISLSMRRWDTGTPLEDIEKSFALELADALAWIISIANFLKIDLQDAFLERYGDGCSKCSKNPCQCVGFSWEPLQWGLH